MNTKGTAETPANANSVEGEAPFKNSREADTAAEFPPKETIELGNLRKQILVPYAESGAGPTGNPLKHDWVELDLEKKLSCSLAFAYSKLKLIRERGAPNIRASELLKTTSDGGRNKPRLAAGDLPIILKAIKTACVSEGRKPGSANATKRVMQLLQSERLSKQPSKKRISALSKEPCILSCSFWWDSEAQEIPALQLVAGCIKMRVFPTR